MSFFEWIALILFLFLVIGALCFIFGKFRWNGNESKRKGNDAENTVVESLIEWSKEHQIRSFVYRFPASLEFHQHIDIIFDSPIMENLGIEVKFRTIHEGFEELKVDDICHMNSNGKRQTTNQLYGYIRNTGRLGLYAFIFRRNDIYSLYFLPHYVLQQIIYWKWDKIYISHITKHPNSYNWTRDNSDFSAYISREFENQCDFFNFRKKNQKRVEEAPLPSESQKSVSSNDYIDYDIDLYNL